MTLSPVKAARPRRVALTGGIATGKSYCLGVFQQLGAPVIDADRVAGDVVAPGSEGLAAVVQHFGPSILLPDGQLDRPALATLVFSDTQARQQLEEIIHPLVYTAIRRWFEALTAPIGIADIPLLFETGHEGDFHVIVVAACRADQQLTRLMARSGLSEADARTRIAAQMPLTDKIARADYVIDTGGTLEQTASRTRAAWEKLQSEV